VPSSFSRFLSEDDLKNVRDQYLDALAALEDEENATDDPDEKGDELLFSSQ
jgi:hypothetical protein